MVSRFRGGYFGPANSGKSGISDISADRVNRAFRGVGGHNFLPKFQIYHAELTLFS